MKVFVAGATGAMGRQLVPRLVAAGHDVVGMTRSESKRAALAELGATPVVADGLDAEQVAVAVGRGTPRRDHPPADRDQHARHAPLRPRLRADQPAADRGHRPPVVGGPRGRECDGSSRRATRAGRTRAPEGRSRARRIRSIRPRRARCASRWRRSATSKPRSPVPTGRKGSCFVTAPSTAQARRMSDGRRAVRDGPQAEVPGGRRRRRGVVVHPHRGRRRGDRRGGRTWPRAGSTTSSTTIRRRSPSGCPALAETRSAPRSRGGCRGSSGGMFAGEASVGDDDRNAWRVERQGEARVRLDAQAIRAGGRGSRREHRRGAARRAATGFVRDRLPDARQRRRGGGRRPGGAADGSTPRWSVESGSSRRAPSSRP